MSEPIEPPLPSDAPQSRTSMGPPTSSHTPPVLTSAEDTQLREALSDLRTSLHQLGKQHPQHLVFFHSCVFPSCPDSERLPALSRALEDSPNSLCSPGLFSQISSPEISVPEPVRTLMDFLDLFDVLKKMTPSQAMLLTRGLVPPGTMESQTEYLSRLQEILRGWPCDLLRQHHSRMSSAPVQQRGQLLLQLEPLVPWELVRLIVELMALSLEEVVSFAQWFGDLSGSTMGQITRLFQMDTFALVAVKTALCSDKKPPPQESVFRIRDRLLPPKTPQAPRMRPVVSQAVPPVPQFAQVPMLHERMQLVQQPVSTVSAPPLPGRGANPLNGVPSPPLQIAPHEMSLVTPAQAALGQTSPALYEPSAVVGNGFSVRGRTASSRGRSFRADNIAPYTPSKPMPTSPLSSKNSGSLLVIPMPPPQQLQIPPGQGSPPPRQGELGLRISKQPPSKTVYQRILKPFPAVVLTGDPTLCVKETNLFVEATLVPADSVSLDVSSFMEGTKVVRIGAGVPGVFKKLKIQSTSQQQGTLFKIKFALKTFARNEFSYLPGATALSDTIEVFSHTLYLMDRHSQDAEMQQSQGDASEAVTAFPPPLAAVSEILPRAGPVDTRVVVLGANYVNSPTLRVRFNDVEVVPTFHESCTLICHVPFVAPGPDDDLVHPRAIVRVSNDGLHYGDACVVFFFCSSVPL